MTPLIIIVFVLLGAILVINLRREMALNKSLLIEELKLFNSILDDVMNNDIKDSTYDRYNRLCSDFPKTGSNYARRSFLNGLLIGLDVEENRKRLLENKYAKV